MSISTHATASKTAFPFVLRFADDGSIAVDPVEGEILPQDRRKIDEVAVPEIRRACSLSSGQWSLRWEELDPEFRVVQRRESTFGSELRFRLDSASRGVELQVPQHEDTRLWVALQARTPPPPEVLARTGWTQATQEVTWSHRRRGQQVHIALSWRLPGIPSHWVAALRRAIAGQRLSCEVDDLPPFDLLVQSEDVLTATGYAPLPGDDPLPLRRHFQIDLPLVVLDAGAPPRHRLEDDLVATIPVVDLLAHIDGESTRYVAEADLEKPFSVTLVTAPDVELPRVLPSGLWEGVPWQLAAAPVERRRRSDRADLSSSRTWNLEIDVSEGAVEGRWRDLTWGGEEKNALTFPFGLPQAGGGPAIRLIARRTARLAWHVAAAGEAEAPGQRLRLVKPALLPAAGEITMRGRIVQFDYETHVHAELDGLDERFVVNESSELPSERLLLDPERWQVTSGSSRIEDGEMLGAVAEFVRWSLPSTLIRTRPRSPAEWASASGPVLIVRKFSPPSLAWGGLFVPTRVVENGGPTTVARTLWQMVKEVLPSRQGEGWALTIKPGLPDIWASLWGYLDRYHCTRIVFAGRPTTVAAWVAAEGLPLFPETEDRLLRSFAPIHAIRGQGTDLFVATSPVRPSVTFGREIVGPGMVDVTPRREVRMRISVAEPNTLPSSFPPPVPENSRLQSAIPDGHVVWMALEHPEPSGTGARSGYLLSWAGRTGWLLRGFFAGVDNIARMGATEHAGPGTDRTTLAPVYLREGSAVSFFLRKTATSLVWSDTTDPEVRRIPLEEIEAWEQLAFGEAHAPEILKQYRYQSIYDPDAIVIEFFAYQESLQTALPLRVWQPHSAQVVGEWDEASQVELVRGASGREGSSG